MTYEEKVNKIFTEKKTNKRKFAITVGLDYSGMNLKIKKNEISLQFIKGLIELYPDVNLNWILKDNKNNDYKLEDETILVVQENNEPFANIYLEKFNKAMALLQELKPNLTNI